MKDENEKINENAENFPDEEIFPEIELDVDVTDVKSIQEFIEKKKLQNRILKTILDKMNQTENKPNTNN
ncbi:MAG: hypothetical protein Q8T08_14195 [Ignavibacteria bacterium]|nr:hypothetical protein [Ignavibacteria bacterium]